MLSIIPVNKTDEDAKLIMKWRNDVITRQNSLNMDIKIWNTFKKEFYEQYFNNIPLFIILNNKKIAFVSLVKKNKNNNNIYKIGINITPEERGKGYSSEIIKLTLKYIKNKYPFIKKIIAEIKNANIPSILAFIKSGFTLQNHGEINTYIYIIT